MVKCRPAKTEDKEEIDHIVESLWEEIVGLYWGETKDEIFRRILQYREDKRLTPVRVTVTRFN